MAQSIGPVLVKSNGMSMSTKPKELSSRQIKSKVWTSCCGGLRAQNRKHAQYNRFWLRGRESERIYWKRWFLGDKTREHEYYPYSVGDDKIYIIFYTFNLSSRHKINNSFLYFGDNFQKCNLCYRLCNMNSAFHWDF